MTGDVSRRGDRVSKAKTRGSERGGPRLRAGAADGRLQARVRKAETPPRPALPGHVPRRPRGPCTAPSPIPAPEGKRGQRGEVTCRRRTAGLGPALWGPPEPPDAEAPGAGEKPGRGELVSGRDMPAPPTRAPRPPPPRASRPGGRCSCGHPTRSVGTHRDAPEAPGAPRCHTSASPRGVGQGLAAAHPGLRPTGVPVPLQNTPAGYDSRSRPPRSGRAG